MGRTVFDGIVATALQTSRLRAQVLERRLCHRTASEEPAPMVGF